MAHRLRMMTMVVIDVIVKWTVHIQVFHEIKSTLFWDGPRGVVSLAYSVT